MRKKLALSLTLKLRLINCLRKEKYIFRNTDSELKYALFQWFSKYLGLPVPYSTTVYNITLPLSFLPAIILFTTTERKALGFH